MTDLPTTPEACRSLRKQVLAQADDLLSSTTVIGEFVSWELSAKVEEAAYKLRAYADLLEAHAQVLEAQQWVSVAERLPEEQVRVLMLAQSGYQCIGMWYGPDIGWEFNSRIYDKADFTYWRYLPAPPAAKATAQAGEAQSG